jgi:fructose/tagatose bisphosphate aldolase
MPAQMSASLQKKAATRISELIGQTLEEEIFTVNSLAPEMVARLPSLFSDSVVDSVTNILGESSGEALIRSIGEERLMSPEETYEKLDSVLHGGSEILKSAIREDFRVRVHRLYKMTLDMAPASL